MGFAIKGLSVSAAVDVRKSRKQGRNVVGRLRGYRPGPAIVVGAHIDHLGRGAGGGSLARGDEQGWAHHGADDNASGVSAMFEVAQYLASDKFEAAQYLANRGRGDLKGRPKRSAPFSLYTAQAAPIFT